MEYLQISEIFRSIQGEGPNLGVPSTFVRVARCNLHCSFCLPPYTYIRTSEGSRAIMQLKEGDELIGYDAETGQFPFTKVKAVSTRKVSNLLAVTIGARSNPFRCTAGHQWLTSNGWKRADDLVIGDELVRAEGQEKSKVEKVQTVSSRYEYGFSVFDLTCEPYPTFIANGIVSHNCDTPYTWRFTEKLPHGRDTVYNPETEIQNLSIETVVDAISDGPRHVVLTGGEPMLQSEKLNEVIQFFKRGYTFEFETAGTVAPLPEWEVNANVTYVVSPKLANSGNTSRMRHRPDVLQAFHKTRSVFKFVVTREQDFDEIDDMVLGLRIAPGRVYIMPEGTTAEAVLRNGSWLTPMAIRRGYKTTTRLHVLLWGNRRGV